MADYLNLNMTNKPLHHLRADEVKDVLKHSIIATETSVALDLSENEFLEFKLSLHCSSTKLDKQYCSLISSFANRSGGAIIFGIDPETLELKGIKSRLKSIDQVCITSTLSEHLEGDVVFDYFSTEINSVLIGVLLIQESVRKPIMMRTNYSIPNNGGDFSRGEIYYRYGGQTRRIDPMELRYLIDKEVESHVVKMRKQFEEIIKNGPNAISLLNHNTGEILTANEGAKLYVSPEMLKEVNLIKEGQFNETEGAPAYILKGEVKIDSSDLAAVEKRPEAIHKGMIYDAFFNGSCKTPREYLKFLLYDNTFNRPVFFLMHEAGLSRKETIEFFLSLDNPDVNKAIRQKLFEVIEKGPAPKDFGLISEIDDLIDSEPWVRRIERIQKGNRSYHKSTIIRTVIFNSIMSKAIDRASVPIDYTLKTSEAIICLPAEFIKKNKSLIVDILMVLRQELTNEDKLKPLFRNAVCHVDYALYGNG